MTDWLDSWYTHMDGWILRWLLNLMMVGWLMVVCTTEWVPSYGLLDDPLHGLVLQVALARRVHHLQFIIKGPVSRKLSPICCYTLFESSLFNDCPATFKNIFYKWTSE